MILTSIALIAFFGFDDNKCYHGDYYDKENFQCYYCPNGALEHDGDCNQLPYLGSRCNRGLDHHYDEKLNRCVYCPPNRVYTYYSKGCVLKKYGRKEIL